MKEKITGYKFIRNDMKSRNGKFKWVFGKWKRHEDVLKVCEKGFHASEKPLDALKYSRARFFEVEARGKIIKDDDKFVASEMRLVKEIDTKKLSVLFSVKCARRCLKNWTKEYPDDKRPLEAIILVEKWIKDPKSVSIDELAASEATVEAVARSALALSRSVSEAAARSELSEARSALAEWSVWTTWAAARSVRSARSAVRSALAVAKGLTEAAAETAAEAAEWSVESKWQNEELKRLIKLCTIREIK